MSIRPVADKILVRLEKVDEITKSGIILPESAIENPLRGKVINVGSGMLTSSGNRIPVDVKIGDVVLCKTMNFANEIELDGEPHLIITENDILGVID